MNEPTSPRTSAEFSQDLSQFLCSISNALEGHVQSLREFEVLSRDILNFWNDYAKRKGDAQLAAGISERASNLAEGFDVLLKGIEQSANLLHRVSHLFTRLEASKPRQEQGEGG